MSYVDSNLMQGEQVVYRTKLHKILFLGPVIFTIALFGLGFWLQQKQIAAVYSNFCYLIGLLILVAPMIQYLTSEFAVTNKRVIVKVGFISRRTVETLLQKIEAIEVNQSILGRMFNWGTIIIIGTGGTNEPFLNIADPIAFRLAVLEQTDKK